MTAHLCKRLLLVVIFLLFIVNCFAQEIVSVDIGDPSQHIQSGWMGWDTSNPFSSEQAFGPLSINITKDRINGVRYLSARNATGAYGDLIEDFVFSGSLKLDITGLPRGIYNLQFWSNDARGFKWSPFNVYIDDAANSNVLLDTLTPTAVTNSDLSLSYSVKLFSDGVEPVTLNLISTVDYPNGIVPLNGFSISDDSYSQTFPRPSQTDVNVDAMLKWYASSLAQSYDLYVGTDSDIVLQAHRLAGDIDGSGLVDIEDMQYIAANWLDEIQGEIDIDGNGQISLGDYGILANDWGLACPSEYIGNYISSQCDDLTFDYGQTYYWRADSRENGVVTQGPVFSFTTADYEDRFISNNRIQVYTSQSVNLFESDNLVNRAGLYSSKYLHNDIDQDMWLGTKVDSTSHPLLLPCSVWLKFELDDVCSLGTMWLWNWNGHFSNRGLRNIRIHYSLTDSANLNDWIELEAVELPQSQTAQPCEPFVIDFAGARSRFVLITADADNGNWGSDEYGDYYGLSEVQFTELSTVSPQSITASASSIYGNRLPINTVNTSGIKGSCHSVASDQMWMSISGGGGSSANHPFGLSCKGWLKYSFDQNYTLSSAIVWNFNMAGYTSRGLRKVLIHSSNTGGTNPANWSYLGEFEIQQADGTDSYKYNTQINFGNINAKYVLLTIRNVNGNWGDPDYYGLSEIEFFKADNYASCNFPVDGGLVTQAPTLVWNSGQDSVSHDVYLGQDYEQVFCANASNTELYQGRYTTNQASVESLDSGRYYWRVDEVDQSGLIFKGDVWSFDPYNPVGVYTDSRLPVVNESVDISLVNLSQSALPYGVVDVYLQSDDQDPVLLAQLESDDLHDLVWIPVDTGYYEIWCEFNSVKSDVFATFVTPVPRSIHHWWPLAGQTWVTDAIKHSDVPVGYWDQRGCKTVAWKYGDDLPGASSSQDFADYWADITSEYCGIAIDEFPYQTDELAMMGPALELLRIAEPDMYITAYVVNIDLANTSLMQYYQNADLLMIETYASDVSQYGRFTRYDAAVTAGLQDNSVASIAIGSPWVETVAELEKQVRYIRATRPDLDGLAFYGVHLDSQLNAQLLAAADDCVYRYFLMPALLLDDSHAIEGYVTIRNIGSDDIDNVEIVLHNTTGDELQNITFIEANSSVSISVSQDFLSAQIEEDEGRYTVIKNPLDQ